MVAVTFEPALQTINLEARPYPAHLLPEGGTALVLFAAAFLGHNDAIHMARKQMATTCVDVDGERLGEMADIYPTGWSFHLGDAWEFAASAARFGRQWDAVSVDTFTGDPESRSLLSLDLWCSLATSIVTVTCSKWRRGRPNPDGTIEEWVFPEMIPAGWNHSFYERSSEVDWLVLTRG